MYVTRRLVTRSRGRSDLDAVWQRYVQAPLGRLPFADAEMLRFQSPHADPERAPDPTGRPYLLEVRLVRPLREIIQLVVEGHRPSPGIVAETRGYSQDTFGSFFHPVEYIHSQIVGRLRRTLSVEEEYVVVFPLFGEAGRIFSALEQELMAVPAAEAWFVLLGGSLGVRKELRRLVDWVVYAVQGRDNVTLSTLHLPREG